VFAAKTVVILSAFLETEVQVSELVTTGVGFVAALWLNSTVSVVASCWYGGGE
jgi:hypothetical protein